MAPGARANGTEVGERDYKLLVALKNTGLGAAKETRQRDAGGPEALSV